MIKNIFKTLVLSLLFAGSLMASDGALIDLDEGRALAASEGKYLLLDFSGSDWCHWCKKLDGEVFNKSEWKKWADDNIVQVVLDFPRRKKQSEEIKIRNRTWMNEFKVTGFPTVFLLDPQGNVVTKTGYQKGGAKNYIEHVEKLIAEHRGSTSSAKG